MKNSFETFSLKFDNRIDFERAHKFVGNRHSEFDVGYSDLILTFFSKSNRDDMAQVLSLIGLCFNKTN